MKGAYMAKAKWISMDKEEDGYADVWSQKPLWRAKHWIADGKDICIGTVQVAVIEALGFRVPSAGTCIKIGNVRT